ncbi:MAG: cation diffusion facilitator family transporter [Hyphomicrobiaceae bacterium]
MAAGSSTKVVLIALTANFLIACAKFSAYLWTTSSAMLSESIHSLVDTSNQALLLYGDRRSKRPADATHPFGYARELYFWSFVVAILLFALGAGFSIYEGIEKLLHPHPITDPYINYLVLVVALVIEGYATSVAISEFNSRRGATGILRALRDSKDPALITILLEDLAAITGLIVAFAGVFLAHVYEIAQADGVASIAIGCVLALVAIFLSNEVKGLLIGEAARPHVQEGIRALINAEKASNGHILAINEIRTMQLGARDVLVAASVDFDDTSTAVDVKETTQRLELKIREAYPEVQKFYIEVQAAADHHKMLNHTKES